MKRTSIIGLLIVVSLGFLAAVVFPLAGPMAAQDVDSTPLQRAERPAVSGVNQAPVAPEWGGAWNFGPLTDFRFTRFDGAYYEGNGLVYFLGGRLADSGIDGSVWSFDPATGGYADTGTDMAIPISNYSANLVQDSTGWGLYTICGRPSAGGVITQTQVYYPDTNTTVALDLADGFPGSEPCTSAMNVVYNNKIYVAGGFDPAASPVNSDETWIFDPMAATGSKWSRIDTATLTTARAYIMSAAVNDKIYAIGGNWFDGVNLIDVTTVEVMDPNAATPMWDDAAALDLPEVCSSSRAFGFDNDSPYVDPDGTPLGDWIISGCSSWPDENERVYAYDTAFDFWDTFPSLNDDRRDHAATFVSGGGDREGTLGVPGMWYFGGRQDADTNVLTTTEYYDLGTGECSILLVEDDWDWDTRGGTPYYTSTLQNLGYAYDLWDTVNMGTPSAATMSPYDVVIWWTGYDWQYPISPTEEAELIGYLDGGGNVFLSSQEQNYAFGNTPLFSDYFWVDSMVDDVTLTTTVGNAPDPIFGGLGPYTMARPDQWDVYWPVDTFQGPYDDEVYVKPGGFQPMNYVDSGNPNSTRIDNVAFKTMYLGWPFEWLPDQADRSALMGEALSWFCQAGQSEMNLIPPFQTGGDAPGMDVIFDLTVVNNLGFSDTFDLSYDYLWPSSGPATVGPVNSGDTADFQVTVSIPANANCLDKDVVVITATATSSPVYSATAVAETLVSSPSNGELTGFIYDANTSLGIPDAYVELIVGDEDIFHSTHTASDGAYTFSDIEACTYEGSANQMGYVRETFTVTVDPLPDSTLDVTLDAADPSLSDSAVSVDVPIGDSDAYNMTLDNNGTGPLNFHVSELPADSIFPAPVPEGPGGVDPLLLSELAAAPNGEATFIVFMVDQADLSAAAAIDDWSQRGQFVYDALVATAQRSQQGIEAMLATENKVSHSFYASNSLLTSGDLNLVNALAARDDVAYVMANRQFELHQPAAEGGLPTDPTVVEWNIIKVNADDVWTDFSVQGEGIVVANMDTGVEWTHSALVNQYRGGPGDHDYNWYMPTLGCGDGSEPCDNDGHGTHTMGTMVGDDGGANQIGMAPSAEWIACKGCEFNSCSTEALLGCGDWMVAPTRTDGSDPDPSLRPHVVNNSWGGGSGDFWYNQIAYAWRSAGIFPVFSNGNSGPSCGTAGSPGDYSNTVGVGATDSNDVIAGFSSRGPADTTGILKPNVSAPGVAVRSSVPGNNYGLSQGTSMAAPHVAGQIALMWSAQPELLGDVQLTQWIVEQTAVPLTSDQGCGGDLPSDVPNNVYGYGRIDAYAAVDWAVNENWDIAWLAVSPEGGTVAPGGSGIIGLNFDAAGLPRDACFTGTLKVEYNDPYVVEEFVPVQLCTVVPTDVVNTYFGGGDSPVAWLPWLLLAALLAPLVGWATWRMRQAT